MRRPRHPLSTELRDLRHNAKSGLYEIAENGIEYSLPLELTRLLKAYSRSWYTEKKEPLVASWYKSLGKFDKKRVVITGSIPAQAIEFYPDSEFD